LHITFKLYAHSRLRSSKGCYHGNHFLAFYIQGAYWHHLANTTEPSVWGGNAALCQITLTSYNIHVAASLNQQHQMTQKLTAYIHFASCEVYKLLTYTLCGCKNQSKKDSLPTSMPSSSYSYGSYPSSPGCFLCTLLLQQVKLHRQIHNYKQQLLLPSIKHRNPFSAEETGARMQLRLVAFYASNWLITHWQKFHTWKY